MTDTFNTPPEDEVLQEDERPMESVPVSIDAVVRTEEMPTPTVGFYTVALPISTSGGAQVLRRDPRRRSAILVTTNNDMYLGNSQGDVVNNAAAAQWPGGVPLQLTTSQEVWASGVGGADTVTVIIENYAR